MQKTTGEIIPVVFRACDMELLQSGVKHMTKQQKKFAEAIVLKGMSRSDAYRYAYPGTDKMSVHDISKKADRAFLSKGVKEEMKRLQAESAIQFSDTVTRESLLCDVTELIEKAKSSAYIKIPDKDNPDEYTEIMNTKAATVLIKAIERAAKMIGADEPERVESNVVVTFEGDFDKYAE